MADEGNQQYPQETDMSSTKSSWCEGSWMDLDVDLLVEVFSYLPFKDLFEVMLVNKLWEKTVTETDNLWEQVEVTRKWDLRGVGMEGAGLEGVGVVGPPLLFRVLRVAKEVKISSAFDHANEHMLWIGGMLGPNLTSLELPTDCPHKPSLPAFESSFLHLKSLVFDGDEDYSHEKFAEYMEGYPYEYQRRTVDFPTFDCPNLTSLSLQTWRGEHDLAYSLNCPQLIKLCLSFRYSSPCMLEAMATRCPNLRWLEVECDESPNAQITRFVKLTHLSMSDLTGDIPDISVWHQLETLCIESARCPQRLEVRHHNLRVLTLCTLYTPLFPILDCPLLESLDLSSQVFDTHFLEDLNLMCPKLKKVEMRGSWQDNRSVEGGEFSLTFSHECLEELILQSKSDMPMHVMCPKLAYLGLTRGGSDMKELGLEVECPLLTTLRISGYQTKSCLLAILSALPSLKSLTIDDIFNVRLFTHGTPFPYSTEW